MRRSIALWALLGIVILCGRAKPAYSQAGTTAAQLNGTVKDPSGSSVAKASLTLREVNTNRTYTAVSNDNGLYVIPNLPPGTYQLSAEATGFANAWAALEWGATVFDASVGGVGGCPFAPGASGNVVTEDLVFMFESMGLATGIDFDRLLAARDALVSGLPEEPVYGHTPQAGLPKGFKQAA